MEMTPQQVSLKDYSSMRIGGTGRLVEISTVEELKEAIRHAKETGFRVHVLGGGTNTYFGEDLSSFLFVRPALEEIMWKEEGEDVYVTAHANVVWDDLVQECVEKGLWGIENLSYIPGTVGGAPVQNIGAYGMELTEVFVSLQALNSETLEVETFDREACHFGYRDSVFKYDHTSPEGSARHGKGKYVILSVTLKLSRTPIPVLHYKPLDSLKEKKDLQPLDVRACVIATRNAKLPNYHEHPNCGSFFKNPIVDQEAVEFLKGLYPDVPAIQMPEGYKIPAGWLIEHVAGMKGVRRGDLGTWPAQALVIVNYGEATADDVDALADEIRRKINEKTGIVLEQEVNRIG